VTHSPANPNPDLLVFAKEEVEALVREAKMGKAPVACHVGTIEDATIAVNAGVHTLEHAYYADRALFELMKEKKTVFVPALAVYERVHHHRDHEIKAQTKMAFDIGVRFACEGDSGPYPHGQNVHEIDLMC
jgi:imidazolonepropionase-like amidohydrolase